MRPPRWSIPLVVLAGLLVACAGGDDDGATTSLSPSSVSPTPAPGSTGPDSTGPGTTTPPPGTSVADTTVPATTVAPATTAPGTSAPATTVACDPIGAQDEVLSNFPELLSSAVGADIRTGAHACFERIVIELAPGPAPTPGGMPGFWVRYATGPITLGQTDDQFIELAGDADLLVTMGAWMFTFDENGAPVGYDGPTDITPTNVTAIEQLYMIDNFEGVHTWAIGLDHRRDFRVLTLTGPDRLVIDIATT